MNNKIIHLSDNSFDTNVFKADGLILVDFWAEWCGPCKMIAPVLDKLADEYADKIKMAKLEIDKNPDTTNKYSVRSVPTLMLFKNGEPIATKVGAFPENELKAFLDMHL